MSQAEITKHAIDMSQYPELDPSPRLLLGPGPSMVPPRVLKAMAVPLIGHFDGEFHKILDRTQGLIRYVFETQNEFTLSISGAGNAAMDAAVGNVIEPGDPVLVCVAGFFAARLVDMARRFGGDVEVLETTWGDIFYPHEIEAALKKRPAKVVVMVHGETSTGIEQPLDEIAKIVHAHGALLVVDTVASLGGVPVRVDEVGIDVCYAGSQKGLSIPPGISPITFSPRAVEVMKARKTPVPSYYLDMLELWKYWDPAQRVYHHTAPISMHFAFYEGLRIIAEEGLEARWARHKEAAQLLYQGIEELGLECFVPFERRLTTLTAVKIPEGVNGAEIQKRLLHKYHIEIGGGIGEKMKGKIWRIGLMGHSARRENVTLLVAALKNLLR